MLAARIAALLLFASSLHGEIVDLTAPEWGVMPTASAAVDDMSKRPRFVTDQQNATGWLAPSAELPLWLRLEWRFPVTPARVTITPAAGDEVGMISRYAVEALHDGAWQQIFASEAPLKTEATHELASARPTTALRLRVLESSGSRLGIAELKVTGEKPLLPLAFVPSWKGVWITLEPSLAMARVEPTRHFLRRSFTVAPLDNVQHVYALAAGWDRYQLYLNGHEALADISYSGGQLRQAKWRDVRQWLRAGENVLAAEVEDLTEVGSRGLLAELLIIRTDGTREIIATDGKWRGHVDPGGTAWMTSGFNDARWSPCTVASSAGGAWASLYRVRYPLLQPGEQFEVIDVDFAPATPKPGETVECTAHLRLHGKLRGDYPLAAVLGQTSGWRNHPLHLGGAVVPAETLRTSQLAPGQHTVKFSFAVPLQAPVRLPVTLTLGPAGARIQMLPGRTEVRTDHFGAHFDVPIDRAAPPAASATGFRKNEIKTIAGTPTFVRDGKPMPFVAWSSIHGSLDRYAAYAASGAKIFRVMFDGLSNAAPGEELEYYHAWFREVDRICQAALAIDPEILLFPALDLETHPQWLFDNPSEQFLSGRGVSVVPLTLDNSVRGQVHSTFMSQAYRELGARSLRRLVEHVGKQPYAANIIGFYVFAGRGGENYWGGNLLNLTQNAAGKYEMKPRKDYDQGEFSVAARRTFREWLQRKYVTPAALSAAWQRPYTKFDDILEPARFGREEIADVLAWRMKPPGTTNMAGSLRDPLEKGVGTLPMDYFECYAEAMGDTFDAWGQAIKDASAGRLITGCYYGYALAHLFSAVPNFAGHTTVDRAYRGRGIDIFASPSEYDEARRAGGHYWGHGIAESMRLHNKLMVYEADHRTFLADIAPKTFTVRETVEVMKREAAAALTRGAGWWWYEFAQGERGAGARAWFNDPDILACAAELKKLGDFAVGLPDRSPAAEVAVFYHGPTFTAQDLFSPSIPLNVSLGRLTMIEQMQRLGFPVDLYNLADIAELERTGKLRQYRMCIFLNPFYLTAPELALLEKCKGDGRMLVWLYAPGYAQRERGLAVSHIEAVIGMGGLRQLNEAHAPVCRIDAASDPLVSGLGANHELAPEPFPEGVQWSKEHGNAIWPLFYFDAGSVGPETKLLGHYVLRGELREKIGALAIRREPQWTSVYSAVPYLSKPLLRALAREAGVHSFWDGDEVLFADRNFLVIHTGANAARGTLRLPRASAMYEVFTRKPRAAASTHEIFVAPFTTAMWYIGDASAIEPALRR